VFIYKQIFSKKRASCRREPKSAARLIFKVADPKAGVCPKHPRARSILMKNLYATTLTALIVTTSIGYAGSVDDAEAGSAAFMRGDYATAERLFTQALGTGGLTSSDRESALVMRARAYIAQGRYNLAMQDVDQALTLDPDDREAATLKSQLRFAAESKGQSVAPQGKQPESERSENFIYLTCEGTTITYMPTGRGYSKGYKAYSVPNKAAFSLNIDLKSREVTLSTNGKSTTVPKPTITTDWINWTAPLEAGYRNMPGIEYQQNNQAIEFQQNYQVSVSRRSWSHSVLFESNYLTVTAYSDCTLAPNASTVAEGNR
jgi:tetratricopeptide (TPR) repeat protein